MEAFFRHYSSVEGFTSVQLEPKMMQLMSSQATQRGDRNLAALLSDIEFIRVIALKEGDSSEFVAEVREVLASGRFPLATSSSEGGQTTKFYLRTTPFSMKSELVMLTYGAKETVVVDIYGEFDLKQVTRLSSIRPK